MKTWLVVGAVVVPLLMVLSIEENPEKSIARGVFFENWCIENAPIKDYTQKVICATMANRIARKEIVMAEDLEWKFQRQWETAQREIK
ncbi:hypothetical protein IACHDJAJ_00014 [Aeromonas phage vB_AdhS_TS3]|nr:hypothetical protein IACHDJAJ_00014 [Aeromonas phage vB_AdhS_TS3]